MTKNALILFYRYPELGKVKTRLAKTLGEEFALKFYTECSNHIIEQMGTINDVDTFIYFTNGNDIKLFNNKHDCILKEQAGGDLGHKMFSAIDEVLSTYEKVLVTATDTPELSQTHIHKAFKSLDSSDFVFGPAFDGGYYLVGMKERFDFIFNDMKWSIDSVLNESIQRIESRSMSYQLLEKLQDIDTQEDFETWIKSTTLEKLKSKLD